MTKIAHMLLAFTALSGCSLMPAQDEGIAKLKDLKAEARKAWAQCLFELDKVEAIRGRNLDDLNLGGSVARNQFMVDCLSADEALHPKLVVEMSRYAAKKGRLPNEMNLNSGTRKLPGDEPSPR